VERTVWNTQSKEQEVKIKKKTKAKPVSRKMLISDPVSAETLLIHCGEISNLGYSM
jgi:hypothetical protein